MRTNCFLLLVVFIQFNRIGIAIIPAYGCKLDMDNGYNGHDRNTI